MLREGHRALDNKEYIAGKLLYEQLVSKLDDASLEYRAAANLLYYKLLLYRRMHAAHQAAEDKNCYKLKALLSELQAIAQKLPEDSSVLIRDAKERYRELTRTANKLAIETPLYTSPPRFLST